MNRRALQAFTLLVGLATIGLGSVQLLFGVDSPVYAGADVPHSPILDSNLRFFGGMALGLGLVLVWIVPSIERRTNLFRAVWLCAWIGGVGRLVSVFAVASPGTALLAFTVLEVIGAPLLVAWQARVARAAAVGPDFRGGGGGSGS